MQGGDGAAGDVGEAGHAEVDSGAACREVVELAEFLFGRGEADLEAFGFTGPALPVGFVDPGDQVVADAQQPWPLGGVNAKQWAPDAAVLVDTGGPVGAAAVAQGDLAAFEVAEEFLPFLLGRGAVFPGGAQFAAAGEERTVAVDGLLGVDRLIPHG